MRPMKSRPGDSVTGEGLAYLSCPIWRMTLDKRDPKEELCDGDRFVAESLSTCREDSLS